MQRFFASLRMTNVKNSNHQDTPKPTICFLGFMHSIHDTRIWHKMIQSLKSDYQIIEIAEGENDELIEEDGITIHSLTKKKGRLRYLWCFIKTSFKTKADVFVANEVETFTLALLLKIFKRKKIIFDCHEFYESYLDHRQPLYFRLYLYFFLFIRRLFGRFFNGIITVTPYMQKQYEKYNKNVVTIYNFPRKDIFENVSPNPELAEELKDKKVLIYQGGMSEARGLLQFFKIIQRLKQKHIDAFLLLVGPGELSDSCLKYIEENQLQNRYKHLGPIPYSELFQYTKLAHIGLNLLKPSFNNDHGFQNKIMEYTGNKVPVLGSSNVETLKTFIVDEGAGETVDFDDTEDGVSKIEKILSDYESYQSNCQEVIEKHHWEGQDESLKKFYAKII